MCYFKGYFCYCLVCSVAQYLCKQEAIKDILNWIELNSHSVDAPTHTNDLSFVRRLSFSITQWMQGTLKYACVPKPGQCFANLHCCLRSLHPVLGHVYRKTSNCYQMYIWYFRKLSVLTREILLFVQNHLSWGLGSINKLLYPASSTVMWKMHQS